jgi:hypothetical protein
MGIHKKKPRATLLDDTPAEHLLDLPWQQEWDGMPEFSSEDQSSWHSLVVHFRNADDLRAFGVLIGQALGPKPKAIWFPAAEVGRTRGKEYIDAPQADITPTAAVQDQRATQEPEGEDSALNDRATGGDLFS